MAKSRHSLRARVSQATGRRRKKPANPVERAFEDVKQLVSDTGDRLFSRSGKSKAASKQAAAKKTAASRKRAGQQRQAAAKKGAVNRIGERRATAKQGGRTRSKSR
ncbi:MAG TPA: hypothetical protein VFH80_14150 [Solirubrobacteraceae bacterium]|nr:hypothetical protein [Solirubrobacteraceae bacterium]